MPRSYAWVVEIRNRDGSWKAFTVHNTRNLARSYRNSRLMRADFRIRKYVPA